MQPIDFILQQKLRFSLVQIDHAAGPPAQLNSEGIDAATAPGKFAACDGGIVAGGDGREETELGPAGPPVKRPSPEVVEGGPLEVLRMEVVLEPSSWNSETGALSQATFMLAQHQTFFSFGQASCQRT